MIELNRSRNNVVLSRRAVLEDERKEMRQAILDRLSPGDVVEGQISNIVDFGAFVDLDGMDGLIHISELSWSHVNHPSEVLEIGQTVKVKVLDIDRDRQRISLGLKQTQTDPWQQVLDSYGEGDVVEGRVTKVVTFGAFVEILPGVEGLVHISELAQHHVENPREVVSQGDPVNVQDHRGRRRAPPALALAEAGRGRRPAAAARRRRRVRAPAPQIDLSEEVFAERAGRRAAARGRGVAGRGRGGRRVEERRRRRASRPRRRRPRTTPPSRSSRTRVAADEASPDEPEAAATPTAGLRSAAEAPSESVPRPLAVAITGGIGAGKSEALRAFARHGARRVSSDEIVHRLLATDDAVRAALASGWARTLGPDGRPTAPRSREIVFADRDALAWLEALLHPLVVARVPAMAGGAGGARPPPVAVTEVPLLYEVGRRDALRRGGRDHRAADAARARARGRRRRARAAAAARRGEGRAAPTSPTSTTARWTSSTRSSATCWRELTAVRRLRAARACSPSSPCCGRVRVRPRRSSRPGTSGSGYPLRYQRDRPRARAQLPPRPGAARGRHLPGEQVQRRRASRSSGAIGLMQLLPDDGEGDRRAHRRRDVPGLRSLRPRDQRPLRLVVPAAPARQVRRRAHRARRLQRGPGRTSTRWRARGSGIQFSETRHYVKRVEDLKKIYRHAYAKDLGY